MTREEAQALFVSNRLHPQCPAGAEGVVGDHAHARVSPFMKMSDGNIWRTYICNCGIQFVATVEK
jgi:hypothetical protein